jgi:hypothetical protein
MPFFKLIAPLSLTLRISQFEAQAGYFSTSGDVQPHVLTSQLGTRKPQIKILNKPKSPFRNFQASFILLKKPKSSLFVLSQNIIDCETLLYVCTGVAQLWCLTTTSSPDISANIHHLTSKDSIVHSRSRDYSSSYSQRLYSLSLQLAHSRFRYY